MPIRTAFFGLAVAIAAVVGAGVIVRSDDVFTNTPARWGRAWHSEPDAFGDLSPTALERRLRADPRLDAVARLATSTAIIAGRNVQALSLEPVHGHMAMTVRRGRLPRRPGEVALGEQSLVDANGHIGGSVSIRTRNGKLGRVRVTGTVVIPPIDERALNLGALFAPGALRRYVDENPLGDYVIRYHSNARVSAVQRSLAKDYDLSFNAFTEPQVPGSVRNLTDTRDVALAVALFFGVLGALSLFHVLIVTTRRRGRHFAVLRVLGFRRRQVRTAVWVQAGVLAIGALVAGLPVGLVGGRAIWRAATDHLGALTDPVIPWEAVIAVVPVTLFAAAAAAWWPGRRIAMSSLTPTLRSE
ncbi:MAG: ABC transporter permease [Acidimicrobiia bacterium]